ASRQSVAEPVAGPAQACRDRAGWATQLERRLLVGLAFQVTEDDRHAVLGRQPMDLLIDYLPGIAPGVLGCGCRGREVGGALGKGLLLSGAFPGTLLGTQRNAESDFVEPAGQRFPLTDGTGLASQR